MDEKYRIEHSHDILVFGFGTTLAMWAVGFFCRLPDLPLGPDLEVAPPDAASSTSGLVPAPVLFFLLLALMLGGGFLAGKFSPRGWRTGLYSGALSSALNLFLVLGMAGERQKYGPLLAIIFIFLCMGVLVGAIGGLIGNRCSNAAAFQPANASARGCRATDINWRGLFALVAAMATLLMIAVGGLVTSFKAGLAVPDWPNTFGYMMFFYPLSKMSGGIYFEHSHRLLGTLVGIAVLVLALQIFLCGGHKWLRGFALAAFILLVAQGVLGGLRVTGAPTWSSARTDMQPSISLAMLHGITAQVIFGLIVVIGIFLSRTWQRGAPRTLPLNGGADRRLHTILAALLMIQLVLGAAVRQQRTFLHLHITIGMLALILAVAAGARAWGLGGSARPLVRLGQALIALAALQGTLGVVALFALEFILERKPSELAQVVAATCHQTISALLLGCTICLLLFTRRFTLQSSAPNGRL